jgi:hypothetical protein
MRWRSPPGNKRRRPRPTPRVHRRDLIHKDIKPSPTALHRLPSWGSLLPGNTRISVDVVNILLASDRSRDTTRNAHSGRSCERQLARCYFRHRIAPSPQALRIRLRMIRATLCSEHSELRITLTNTGEVARASQRRSRHDGFASRPINS